MHPAERIGDRASEKETRCEELNAKGFEDRSEHPFGDFGYAEESCCWRTFDEEETRKEDRKQKELRGRSREAAANRALPPGDRAESSFDGLLVWRYLYT